jgi:hypothetical protein
MVVHLASFADIWMERGHHWFYEEVDALADLIGVLSRDAPVGYLARTMLGAFLPHTTADQASRLARDIRAAAESAHRPGRPEGWPLAIGLEPVEAQEPVANDLELLAYATAGPRRIRSGIRRSNGPSCGSWTRSTKCWAEPVTPRCRRTPASATITCAPCARSMIVSWTWIPMPVRELSPAMTCAGGRPPARTSA